MEWSKLLLLTLEDYDRSQGSPENVSSLLVTGVAVFALLWVIEGAGYLVYNNFKKVKGGIFGEPMYITKFSRHTMDVVSMIIFSVMGFEALGLAPFGGWDAIHTMVGANGKVVGVGHPRAYVFSAAAQRLCLWQVAYQCKNFCDAVIHNDGPLFLAHHVVTGLLAALSLRPFLHIYCAYFLGVSEISTAILCGLVLFDEDRGVAPLGKHFPMLMQLVGVAFAVAFITVRIVFWPYACYYFWIDMLALHNDPKQPAMHSWPVGYIFMSVNLLLTLLQFFWLSEIISRATDFFKNGSVSTKATGGGSKAASASASRSATASAKKSKKSN